MSFTKLSIVSKRIIVTRLICFFWIIGKIISWKVWLAHRLFPVVPPFNFLFVPSIIHTILFILSFALLFLLFLFPSKKILLTSVIIIELLSCLLDQNRWQPWEYQYIFMILALIINYKNDTKAVSIISFIMIAIYFFSGISKLNSILSLYLYNQLVQLKIAAAGTSYLYNIFMYHLGYVAGFIEILLSTGLLFHRTKKSSAIFLIAMHILILAIVGPLGKNYNVIIWPWNIAMIFLLYLIFISNSGITINFRQVTNGWNKIFIIFWVVLPFLNFFGLWDYYLSCSLYSYRPPRMYICLHKEQSNKALDVFFDPKKNKFLCDSNSALLDLNSWSLSEMKVPVYPEIRIYKSIKEQLLIKYPGLNASFIVATYSNGRKITIELK